jgi:hypothetical protein
MIAAFRKCILLLILIFSVLSCSNQNRFHGKYADLNEEVKIHRFDLDFISLDTINTEAGLKSLAEKYPAFYPFFISNILGLNVEDSVGNAEKIAGFLKNSTQRKVFGDIKSALNELSIQERNLQQAFSALHYYFPEKTFPDMYAMTTGFNLQFATDDDVIAIGTDFYLGSDYPVYKDVTYDYLIKNFRLEQFESDVLGQLLYNWFTVDKTSMTLLDNMLYEGKLMYLKEIAFPDFLEELLMGYTEEENDWFIKHEKQILSLIFEKKYLYSTDYKLINEMIQPAPFCSPVSQDAPGRLGVRLGWEIVRSFMDNNKDVTLPELMNNRKYQQIFEKSYYRP